MSEIQAPKYKCLVPYLMSKDIWNIHTGLTHVTQDEQETHAFLGHGRIGI